MVYRATLVKLLLQTLTVASYSFLHVTDYRNHITKLDLSAVVSYQGTNRDDLWAVH